MKKDISYLQLFMLFFKINSLTFGGGYTIVPVVREEFAIKRNLIDDDTMLNIIALAQTGPGAMAISTSLLTGYKLKGVPGAIVSLIASVLPCIIIITIISYFYQTFSQNFWVKSALLGMSGVISAVLLVTTFNLGRSALKSTPVFSVIMMVSAFTASFFLGIHTALIILFLGLCGLIVFTVSKEGALK